MGVQRVDEIIRDLRSFSRSDEDRRGLMGVEECVDHAIRLVKNQYQEKIRFHKQFRDIPSIFGSASQLNQVFVNIFLNAAQAMSGTGDIEIIAAVLLPPTCPARAPVSRCTCPRTSARQVGTKH